MRDGAASGAFTVIPRTFSLTAREGTFVPVLVVLAGRVPVFVCHSESVTVEFKKPITVLQARKALQKAEGIVVVDKHAPEDGFMTPVEAAGEDSVYVSRIRKDDTVKHGLTMWVVADNLRKGAATNAVQIAEVLTQKYF